MPARTDSETNLNRLTKNQSRLALGCELSETSTEEFSSSGSENTLSSTARESTLRRRRSSRASGATRSDPASIESEFREIERETTSRENRKRGNDGKYKSHFAKAHPTPVLHTIFDEPSFKSSKFFGFYIFFWLSIGFFILKNIIHSYFDDKIPLYKAPVWSIFTTGLVRIALTDLLMYLSIYVVFFIQCLCAKKVIQWRKTGRTLTSIYEFAFLCFWCIFICEHLMKDQWIGRVFLVLHMFVMLMKMHSYAFYNGYLWKILRELQFSENYYKKIENDPSQLPEGFEIEHTKDLVRNSIAFCKFELLHQSLSVESAKESGVLDKNSEELCKELVKFPGNINLKNFAQYTLFPTLSYTLVYARTKKINKLFLFEKICAMVGVIFLMLVIADGLIYPIVIRCNEFRAQNASFRDMLIFALLALIDIIPPFTMEYMFVFYLIWDVILSAIAEVTRFADRDFYGPWWSCTDWLEYSRFWNKPVHVFLLRHVYHSSISAFSLSKTAAGIVTFFISSVVHELVMYVIFGRVRGFLFSLQMFQIPLVIMSRSRFLRDKKVLGNVVCWFGFVLGPPLIAISYLVF